MIAIAATHLSKSYQNHRKSTGLVGSFSSLVRRKTLETRAVDDVSFSIDAGEVVGFLGPNGAGKTTTLKMLSGLLHPSDGSVTVLGHTPTRRESALLRRIAFVMGQKLTLWHDLPTLDMLLIFKEIYGLSDATFQRNLDELAEILDVRHLLQVQVRKVSLGERMKLELLTALLHQPEVLFLDEPTIGLDVVAQQRIRDFLRRLNRDYGTTILLTSHYLQDIEDLCPRVLVIDHGHLRFDGALASLVHQHAPRKRIEAVFAAPVDLARIGEAVGPLADAPCTSPDDPLRVQVTAPRATIAAVTSRLMAVAPVVDVTVRDVPVEEVVRALFSQFRDGGGQGLPMAESGQ